MADEREQLGRLVRETWVQWASEQENPKNSWLTGWGELDEGQREVDMRIGEAVAARVRDPMWEHAYMRVQAVLDKALGTEEEDGAGAGLAADVALLAVQRDEARAAAAKLRELVQPGLFPPEGRLEAIGDGPLLDPDCRDGKHTSCMGPPCECPVPGVHTARHEHERSQP